MPFIAQPCCTLPESDASAPCRKPAAVCSLIYSSPIFLSLSLPTLLLRSSRFPSLWITRGASFPMLSTSSSIQYPKTMHTNSRQRSLKMSGRLYERSIALNANDNLHKTSRELNHFSKGLRNTPRSSRFYVMVPRIYLTSGYVSAPRRRDYTVNDARRRSSSWYRYAIIPPLPREIMSDVVIACKPAI